MCVCACVYMHACCMVHVVYIYSSITMTKYMGQLIVLSMDTAHTKGSRTAHTKLVQDRLELLALIFGSMLRSVVTDRQTDKQTNSLL